MVLLDEHTGEIERHPNLAHWTMRSRNMDYSSHNHLRISTYAGMCWEAGGERRGGWKEGGGKGGRREAGRGEREGGRRERSRKGGRARRQ
jgi:hypothetical protein